MSRSASFALCLFGLLAALVAAAWGLPRIDEARGRAEIGPAEAVCYYQPGHLFAPLDAADAAEARAAFAHWPAHVCRFDPSEGSGFLSAREAFETRGALAAAGSLPWALAWVWSLGASLGLVSIGHGLLVGGLTVFNPAFVRIGWWLLPAGAASAGSWLGAAALLLAPRYVRRRASIEAMRRTPKPWLTPKRVAMGAGAWMTTFAVLAAVYPTIHRALPPVVRGIVPVSGAGRVPPAVTAPAGALVANTSWPEPASEAVPPPSWANAGVAGAEAGTATGSSGSAAGPAGSPLFGGAGLALTGAGTAAGGAPATPVQTASNDVAPSASFHEISVAFPPNIASPVRPDQTVAPVAEVSPADTPSPGEPAPAETAPVETVKADPTPTTPPEPGPSPTTVAPEQVASAPEAVAVPIIDPANPLPSSPGAIAPAPAQAPVVTAELPAPPPVASEEDREADDPEPVVAPGDDTATPAPEQADDAEPGPVPQPVPEPGTLGLFGLGVLLLGRRRLRR